MKLDIENNIVIKVLKSSFLARNDRKYLYSAVCIDTLKEKGYTDNDISEFLTILYQLPKESNVIRQAAYIQNTLGLYPPTERIKKCRKYKEVKCREEYKQQYTETINLKLDKFAKTQTGVIDLSDMFKENKKKNWLQRLFNI